MQGRKAALVCGAGGFIGSHLVTALKAQNYFVVGVDLKKPSFSPSSADEFRIGDLCERLVVDQLFKDFKFDEVYQLAADMGGAGYIFTGDNDATLMFNSASINLNVLESIRLNYHHDELPRIFYSSSACIYPQEIQRSLGANQLRESDAYPANPDSEYGWEKLFSERLYFAYERNFSFDVRVARYHNIYGPEGTYQGGREKAPAAICRKVAVAQPGGSIEIWGSGQQQRSFLYISDCVEATIRMMQSQVQTGVLNIGSEEAVTIDELARLVISASGKEIEILHVDGPVGVNGRNSENTKIREALGWDFLTSLEEGIRSTYAWVASQLEEPTPRANT